MNGSRGRSNNYLLDGTDMNDGYRNDPAINEAGVFGDPATILPIDAVGELRVLSNYEAEYGRNSGAIVNIVTKSGTNQWHGSALEYYRSGGLGARNYFNIDSQPKNPFTNNQFGGSLGGPIVKDKTFFFVDYEGQRETGCAGGVELRAGSGRQIAAARAQALRPTEPAKPDDVEPAGAQSVANAQHLPERRRTGRHLQSARNGNAPADNLATSTRFNNNMDSFIAKDRLQPQLQQHDHGPLLLRKQQPEFPIRAAGRRPAAGLQHRHADPCAAGVAVVREGGQAPQVNEARLGWNRFAEGFFPEDGTFDPKSIGLDTGVTSVQLRSAQDFGRRTSLSSAQPAGVPRQRVDTNWHFIDNYSWKIGRHDLKFGYEFRRTSINIIAEQQFPRQAKLSLTSLRFLEGFPSGGSQAAGAYATSRVREQRGFLYPGQLPRGPANRR